MTFCLLFKIRKNDEIYGMDNISEKFDSTAYRDQFG